MDQWNLKMFLIGGIFFKLEAMWANVLVEFENVFFYWGHFFKVGGIILGSRKSAILGIIYGALYLFYSRYPYQLYLF